MRTQRNSGIPHIIPRFYLANFCNEATKKITVYSKNRVPYSSTPYKIAKQRKYYCLEKVPDIHKNLPDEILTVTENNNIQATHVQLLNCDLNISSVNKINYATFMLFLFCRTKTFRDLINKQYANKLNKKIRELAHDKAKFSEALKDKFSEEDIEKVRVFAINDTIHEHCKIEADKDTLIYAMTNTGSNKKYINILANMEWSIITTTHKYPFMASDHPISIYNSKQTLDLSQKDANVTLPLSTKICLMLSWEHAPSIISPVNVRNHSQIVTNINKRILDWAYKEAYAGLINEFTRNLLNEFGFISQSKSSDAEK